MGMDLLVMLTSKAWENLGPGLAHVFAVYCLLCTVLTIIYIP